MMTIGSIAKAADVNVETIRYYQRVGMLREPPKPLGGQRHYTDADFRRLKFIKRAQVLGFSLSDISNLLRLDGTTCCGETRDLAVHKLALIDAKIADLANMRLALAGLVEQCKLGHNESSCPIIQSLAE